MKLIRSLPRSVTRPVSFVVLIAWVGHMAALVNRSYLQATSANLATDLGRYGSTAQWRSVYYRGEKIGFTVSQIVPADGGFELQEDGRLQMSLFGATTPAAIRTTARVDAAFALHSFDFSLNPGTGPITVRGRVDEKGVVPLFRGLEKDVVPLFQGHRLVLAVTTSAGTRTEERELSEPPVLALNLSRRLASGGLTAGARHRWTVFDPATLRNAPVTVDVGKREVVRDSDGRPVPAFRVEMEFAGLRTTSWVTDTGEVLREESPLGLMTVRESAEKARSLAVPWRVQVDLLEASAVVPVTKRRIDEPRDVRRLRLRLEGADLSSPDLRGVGQTVEGTSIEIRDPQSFRAGPADRDAWRFVEPGPLIESDDAEIRAEAELAVRGVSDVRARAERLTRHVNAILDKKPTVSLPSAREVLRTKVGDCNEHTALYVAMARALGIPARIAVGLTYVRGAFYYHAWPEVYLAEGPDSSTLRQAQGRPEPRRGTTGLGAGRGLWLPVDPTLNQFPADATHLRLARGGLDKQAVILPLIGRLKITVLDLELAPNATPILVGRPPTDLSPLSIPIPQRRPTGCWSSPASASNPSEPDRRRVPSLLARFWPPRNAGPKTASKAGRLLHSSQCRP